MADIIKIGIDPILVRLGPIAVHWYGLMYVVGILAAIYITIPYAERRGISKDAYYGIFWPVLIAALVGGRLYYVVQSNLGWYLQHPQNILATWEGGMAFYGAIFLGVPALILACRRLGVNPAVALDVAALFAPVGQAFGRIGNIINGDIVGYPSTLPWATAYANPGAFARPLCTAPYTHCVAFQPAAAYELIFSGALFALLWRLRDRPWPAGMHFVAYLALYSLGQLVVFIWRDNVFVL